jgi:glycerol-3-phosphate dehydrogenase (NAD(P)+)
LGKPPADTGEVRGEGLVVGIVEGVRGPVEKAGAGGRAETVSGLSGLGDLLLTCTGAGSRNFSFGLALGRGETVADILAARDSVTEGVATAPALVARARALGVELPIAEAVAAVVQGRLSVAEAMRALLGRRLRDE